VWVGVWGEGGRSVWCVTFTPFLASEFLPLVSTQTVNFTMASIILFLYFP
jgi:hypothetical protein